MSTEERERSASSRSEQESAALQGAIEAMLLSLDRPIQGARIAEALSVLDTGLVVEDEVSELVDALNAAYEETGRAFCIERVAGGYRIMTRPEHAPAVAALVRQAAPSKLSRAALETLAVVAYRQPVTRAQLEAIRGVACGEVLRSLLDRRLITIKGRAEELGRPMLYGTTKQFLDVFGLPTLKDLPKPEELAGRE